jgi:hypothetical protein
VNNPADTASRDAIRIHVQHIAQMFQRGDFDIPMFVHNVVPPGALEMRKLQSRIRYVFEETPNGGRLVMSSSDVNALDAIHCFLHFQIAEHRTGDPT